MSVQDLIKMNQTPIFLVISWGIVLFCVFIIYFFDNGLTDLQLTAMKLVAIAIGFFAMMTTIGFFAFRAGYRQEELDKMGNDILSGRKF